MHTRWSVPLVASPRLWPASVLRVTGRATDAAEPISAVSVGHIYLLEKPEEKPVLVSNFRTNAGWQLCEADCTELIILLDKARLLHCLIR